MAVVKRFRYLTHPKAPLAGTGVNLDIDGWLRGIGLGQYIELFRANDVDGEVLPKLTADDLISISITSVGHRRKLLQAIAALGAEVAAPPKLTPQHTAMLQRTPMPNADNSL